MKMKAKVMLIICALMVGFSGGIICYDKVGQSINAPKAEVIEEYTVKPYDTMWTISERYRMKDCRNPYILEYKYELEKLNPEVKPGALQVGEKIKVRYYVED